MLKKTLIFILSLLFFSIIAQAQKGKIAGKIIDKKTGEDIIGATITLEGTTNGVSSDIDGKYFMQVEPGTYTILISYISYKTLKMEGIVVKPGELTYLDGSIEENSTEIDEVVIQGEVRKESVVALILQQKNMVSMSSGISAELIKRLPDRTTADVIKRVAGATIQDGKFAIIRGMQDRYNYGMINGAPLPSSEPDRKAFSLDLVPAQVIDNMVISKTATPDMPGDFAGGLIQINTKDIPDENTRFINIGGAYQSITTSNEFFKSPQSSSTDFLGFDNGPRQLPVSIGTSEVAVQRGIFDYPKEIVDDTRKFNNDFTPRRTNALPNLSMQMGASQRIKVLGNYLGVIAAVTYNNSNSFEPYERNSPVGIDSLNRFNYNRTDSTIGTFYDYERSRNTVNTGGILNFTYKIGQTHKLFFKNLLTFVSNDQTILRSQRAYNPGFPAPYVNDKDIAFFYQGNRSFFSQIGGEHILYEPRKLKLTWVSGLTNLNMNSPDFKRNFSRTEGFSRIEADTSTRRFINGIPASPGSPNNPGRYFFDLQETGVSLNTDLSVSLIKQITLKGGVMAHYRDRIFTGRNFNITNGQLENLFLGDIQRDLYTGYNNYIADTLIYQIETTQRQDKYGASSMLTAGFLMAEAKITPSFRAIGGLRLESFNQKINSGFGPLSSVTSENFAKVVDTTWTDFLPSLNLIYALTDQINLRAGYSRTLSRPEFREFARLSFFDFTRNAIFVGNSGLVRSRIDNFDVKFEFYPVPQSFFSINPFLKIFKDPIENLVQPSQGFAQVTYENARSALNYGVELEARYSFSNIDIKVLKNFTVFGNLSLIQSSINQENLREKGLINKSVSERPLQGQSPYVFNIGLQYQTQSDFVVTFATNTYGRRIVFVAPQDEFLVYEAPRWVIDGSVSKTFAKKFNAKITIGDLLAQPLAFYYDFNKSGSYEENKDEVFEKFRRGYTVGIGFGYNF
ncbi:MAG: TonB-dependent receptor [Cytophagales bacterium]|nr:MAG: TonB-dependent receptor [Cytophagales bacterium]